MRKVEPLARALEGKQAWLTGLRRDEAPTRAERADRRLRRRPRHREGQPDRELDPRRDRRLHRRPWPPRAPAARQGVPVDRLLAVHQPGQGGRRPARRSLDQQRQARVRAPRLDAVGCHLSVHEVASSGFGAEADAYERARPSYPPDAVAWIVDALGLTAGGVVCDVAAGTGKFTRLLARRPARGSWPSNRSRGCGRDSVACPLRRRGCGSTAVRRRVARRHHRRPGVPLVRRRRRAGRVPPRAATREDDWRWCGTRATGRCRGSTRCGRSWTGSRSGRRGGPDDEWRESAFVETPWFGPLHEATFHHEQVLSPADVVERVRSVSHVAVLPPEQQGEVLDEVRTLLRDDPADRGSRRGRTALPGGRVLDRADVSMALSTYEFTVSEPRVARGGVRGHRGRAPAGTSGPARPSRSRSGTARVIRRPVASVRCASSAAGRRSPASRSPSTRRPHHLAYVILSGLPVHGYHADVDVFATTTGSTIRWAGAFEPKVPGTGELFAAGARADRAWLRTPRGPRGRTPRRSVRLTHPTPPKGGDAFQI